MTGEAMTLLAILATQGLVGLDVGATAFSRDAVIELVDADYALEAHGGGRLYITLEGAKHALAVDID